MNYRRRKKPRPASAGSDRIWSRVTSSLNGPIPRALAVRMHAFCLDKSLAKASGDVHALAEALGHSDALFFWWD